MTKECDNLHPKLKEWEARCRLEKTRANNVAEGEFPVPAAEFKLPEDYLEVFGSFDEVVMGECYVYGPRKTYLQTMEGEEDYLVLAELGDEGTVYINKKGEIFVSSLSYGMDARWKKSFLELIDGFILDDEEGEFIFQVMETDIKDRGGRLKIMWEDFRNVLFSE